MSAKGITVRQRIHDYLFHLEAMTRREAKQLWRQSIKDAWKNRCAYCNNPPIDDASLTLDHVRPKAKGGEDRTSNCVPACKRCNHSKGSENWVEWFGRQEFYSIEREYRIRAWIEANQANIPKSGDIYDCHEFASNLESAD